MKLARIILPERNNDNQHLTGVHQVLRNMLMFHFGGYTMTKGTGGWNHDGKHIVEQVFVYDIAMERADTPTLRRIAAQVAADAKQDCVMMVTPNGDVEFVKPLAAVDNRVCQICDGGPGNNCTCNCGMQKYA